MAVKINAYFNLSSGGVSVEADNPTEFQKALAELNLSLGDEVETGNSVGTGSAEPVEAEKPKRGRPRKADKEPEPAPETSDATDEPSLPLGEPEKQPEPEVTEGDLRASFEALVALGVEGAQESIKIVQGYDYTKGDDGLWKLSRLRAEHFAEAKQKADEAVARLTAAKKTSVL